MEIQVGEIVLHLDEETLSYSIRTGGKNGNGMEMERPLPAGHLHRKGRAVLFGVAADHPHHLSQRHR